MAFSNTYTFAFATGVCVFCSVAVAGAAIALQDQQALNRERDLHKSILSALQLVDRAAPPPGEEIDRLWDERVRIVVHTADGTPVAADDASKDLDGDKDVDLDDVAAARAAVKGTDTPPALLAVYQRVSGDAIEAYAVPLTGKGLWGPVSGYLALDPKLEAVTGVTFFAPKETPGLGAEIEAAAFQAQWSGKRVFDANGKVKAIQVAKAGTMGMHAAEADHWVDGLSGATITCRGVTEMVVRGLEREYAPTLVALKQGVTP